MLSNDNNTNALDMQKLRAYFKAKNIEFDLTDEQIKRFLTSIGADFDNQNNCIKKMQETIDYIRTVVRPSYNTKYGSMDLSGMTDGDILSILVRKGCMANANTTASSQAAGAAPMVECLHSTLSRTTSASDTMDINQLRSELKAMYPDINWDEIPDNELLAMMNKAQLDASKTGVINKNDTLARINQLGRARGVNIAMATRRREAFY